MFPNDGKDTASLFPSMTGSAEGVVPNVSIVAKLETVNSIMVTISLK